MKKPETVPRLLDPGSGIPDRVREVLGHARDTEASSEELARLDTRMQELLVTPPPCAPDAPPAPSSPAEGPGVSGSQAAGALGAFVARHKALTAGLAVLAIAVGIRSLVSSTKTQTSTALSPASASSSGHLRVPPGLSVDTVVVPSPSAEPSLAKDEPSGLRVAVRDAGPHDAPLDARTEAAGPEMEVALLRQAMAALRAGRAASALAMTSKHAKVYPRSSLSQERELIVIEALVRLGRRAEAVELGRRFMQGYPDSAHARRVHTILGVPVENAMGDAGSDVASRADD